MEKPVKVIDAGEYRVEIRRDNSAMRPDEFDSSAGCITAHHRQFTVRVNGIPDDWISIPLYAHIHGGIVLSLTPFSDRWDSCRVGSVHLPPDADDDQAQAIVAEWNQWLSGDVYGYVIIRKSDNAKLESCWGFYGLEYCEQEAKNTVGWMQDNDKKCAVLYHL